MHAIEKQRIRRQTTLLMAADVLRATSHVDDDAWDIARWLEEYAKRFQKEKGDARSQMRVRPHHPEG